MQQSMDLVGRHDQGEHGLQEELVIGVRMVQTVFYEDFRVSVQGRSDERAAQFIREKRQVDRVFIHGISPV